MVAAARYPWESPASRRAPFGEIGGAKSVMPTSRYQYVGALPTVMKRGQERRLESGRDQRHAAFQLT